MRTLKRFCSLGPADRKLLLQALALLWAARLGVRWFGFQALRRYVRRIGQREANTPERIAWAVRTAGRSVPRSKHCLASALAEQALLRRSGHAVDLKLGVRRSGNRLRAHAWVTPDHASEEFVPLNGSL